jgi:anaerobic ribonucleoside-triphosphate reductase
MNKVKNKTNLKCESCGKEDETVSVRNCGYDADVNNNPNSLETVCDDCEEQHCLDI